MVKTRTLAPLLLFLGALTVYLATGRNIGSGDTLPNRYLPFSLIREGNFDLDEFPALYDVAARRSYPVLDGIPYYLHHRNGHYVSAYSPGPALLALPVFVGPVLAGLSPGSPWVPHIEKLAAALIVALSVAVLYLALAEIVPRGQARLIALVYAFGTSSLSVSSQALWQHGPSQLCLSFVLYGVVRGLRDNSGWALAGVAAGAAVLMRSTNLLIVAPLAAYLVLARRRTAIVFFLGALPGMLLLVSYQFIHFGVASGGFPSRHTVVPTWAFFTQTPVVEGLLGVLLSPGRGLFFYSPILVLALVGMVMTWRRGPIELSVFSLGVLALVLVTSKWFMWWGGHSYGPRLLADGLPVYCFFLYPLAEAWPRRRLLRVTVLGLAVLSVAVHALGAFRYDMRWDALVDVDRHPEKLWRWTESQIAFYAGELLAGLRPGRPVGLVAPSGAAAALSATFAAAAIPSEVFSGETLDIEVVVTNTGLWRWLPGAGPDERGALRLGWRWERDGRIHAQGRYELPDAVAPGKSLRLEPKIGAPTEPGAYILIMDLVAEHVAWAASQGSAPIIQAVKVSALRLDQFLTRSPSPMGEAPSVKVRTDRASYTEPDPLQLTVELGLRGRPRPFNAYLVVTDGDGRGCFFDGHDGWESADRPAWLPWASHLPLPARVIARFTLPARVLGAGPHEWHAILTEAGSYRVVGRAAAGFLVEAAKTGGQPGPVRKMAMGSWR